MGDGNKRSNTVRVSARDAVMTSDGGLALTCPEDGTTAVARVDQAYVGRDGVLATDGESVWVEISGRRVADLAGSSRSRQLAGCLERGFAYSAALGKRTVEFRISG